MGEKIRQISKSLKNLWQNVGFGDRCCSTQRTMQSYSFEMEVAILTELVDTVQNKIQKN